MFSQMNVQQAMDDGGRYASTGQATGGSGPAFVDYFYIQIEVRWLAGCIEAFDLQRSAWRDDRCVLRLCQPQWHGWRDGRAGFHRND